MAVAKLDGFASLYPKVDESETPLPRAWSARDKYSYIGLSQGNLRVHYKGSGKNHKDAASVRATHPIPTECGVYYFEIRVISKGRDGYMGIGLSAPGVNLNRLPGWEKNTYGYHADDGCVFSSTSTGQQYGPTFTTGDVVGCGLNLVDRSVFFTKNGITLGTAITDVPAGLSLYPTVGLQTPGEIVEANFGESSFVFDFEGMLAEMQQKIRRSIEKFEVRDGQGAWQANLHKLLLSYLVHHGYSQTAQVFAASTGQMLEEDAVSIKNRQKIQSLILRGQISNAVHMVRTTYPGLLETNLELLFRLKCRQFVEMVAGNDSGDVVMCAQEPRLSCHSELSFSSGDEEEEEGGGRGGGRSSSRMGEESAFVGANGVAVMNGGEVADDSMEVDSLPVEGCDGGEGRGEGEERVDFEQNRSVVERLLGFGRELQVLHDRLTATKSSEPLKALLQDSFSLLAYTHPHSSPVGYLLDPVQREPVCAALNSAILESKNLPGQPPLEFALGQAVQCLKHMSRNGLGSAAFTGVTDVINS